VSLPPPSRRALPERDEAIEALDPASRALLAQIWAARAKSELGAGSGFAILVTELYELGADPVVLRLATRASHDEVRHSELCRLLAEAYAGAPVPSPRPKRVGMPPHRGADDVLRAHLHVVGLSCINETLAASFVEACLRDATAPLVRAIQLEHLSDEIEHARVGWAHLASGVVDNGVRRGVERWLPRLVRANLDHWRSRIGELPEHGVRGHGYPPRAHLVDTIERAMCDIVLPGFEHVRIDATAARTALS